jgi:hypothetical protein
MTPTAYLFSGGGYLTATDATDFVDKMMRSSLVQPGDADEYMEEVAYRCFLFSGACIRCDTAQHFLTDLLAENFVIRIALT